MFSNFPSLSGQRNGYSAIPSAINDAHLRKTSVSLDGVLENWEDRDEIKYQKPKSRAHQLEFLAIKHALQQLPVKRLWPAHQRSHAHSRGTSQRRGGLALSGHGLSSPWKRSLDGTASESRRGTCGGSSCEGFHVLGDGNGFGARIELSGRGACV